MSAVGILGPSNFPRSRDVFSNPFGISSVGVLKREGIWMFIPLLVRFAENASLALILAPQYILRGPIRILRVLGRINYFARLIHLAEVERVETESVSVTLESDQFLSEHMINHNAVQSS